MSDIVKNIKDENNTLKNFEIKDGIGKTALIGEIRNLLNLNKSHEVLLIDSNHCNFAVILHKKDFDLLENGVDIFENNSGTDIDKLNNNNIAIMLNNSSASQDKEKQAKKLERLARKQQNRRK